VFALLALLAGGVTHWDTIKAAFFPPAPATAARIVAHVEQDISLGEYEVQDQPPAQRPASTATTAPGGSPRSGSGYRLAAYAVPVSTPAAVGLLAVASEERTSTEQTTTTSGGATQKNKEEGAVVTEEARRAEEAAAREKAKATAEQQVAEAREREEQRKEQAAQKRAEETQKQGAARAKTEAAKARGGAEKAKETVRVKRQEAARPPSQRRAEAGTPAGRVEAVLYEARLPAGCRPTCGLKPIVEKVLKATSNNTAAAAREVRAVNPNSGARVHYEVTLKGLEHKVVVLTYALVQTSGAPPPEPYLATVAIKTVAPAYEPEVVRGTCWVPVPSSFRQYYLDLTVYDGKTELESVDTRRFS
jgi:hypothetical protein